MANTIITPSIIANEILDNLYESVTVSRLVWRDFDDDFNGRVGDTINVRTPATFSVNEFARPAGITVQDATESSQTIVLNKVPDVSFSVTSEEWTLEVSDFSEQFLAPAASAIGEYLDNLVTDAIAGAATGLTNYVNGGTNDPTDLVELGRELNEAKVPMANRRAIMPPATAAAYLKDPLMHQADQRGDTQGLREASIGRVFGFDTYMTTHYSTAGQHISAFVPEAVALAVRVPSVPRGIAPSQAATASIGGFGLRVISEYDHAQKEDVISVDLLCGVKVLDTSRLVHAVTA